LGEVVVGWDCGVGAVEDGEGYEGVEDEGDGELLGVVVLADAAGHLRGAQETYDLFLVVWCVAVYVHEVDSRGIELW